jgi:hypothetical protein
LAANIGLGWKWLAGKYTVVYNTEVIPTAIKKFMLQAHSGVNNVELFFVTDAAAK